MEEAQKGSLTPFPGCRSSNGSHCVDGERLGTLLQGEEDEGNKMSKVIIGRAGASPPSLQLARIYIYGGPVGRGVHATDPCDDAR